MVPVRDAGKNDSLEICEDVFNGLALFGTTRRQTVDNVIRAEPWRARDNVRAIRDSPPPSRSVYGRTRGIHACAAAFRVMGSHSLNHTENRSSRIPVSFDKGDQGLADFLATKFHGALDGEGKRELVYPVDEFGEARVQSARLSSVPRGYGAREPHYQFRHRAGGGGNDTVRMAAAERHGDSVRASKKANGVCCFEGEKFTEIVPVAARIFDAGEAAGIDESAHGFDLEAGGALRKVVEQDGNGVAGFPSELKEVLFDLALRVRIKIRRHDDDAIGTRAYRLSGELNGTRQSGVGDAGDDGTRLRLTPR